MNPALAPSPSFIAFARTTPWPPTMPHTLTWARRCLSAYLGRAPRGVRERLDVERMHKAIRIAHFRR